jgi:cytidylate kinase
MGRYFFHIQDRSEVIDNVGTEVASPERVRALALQTASRIIGEDETFLDGRVLSVRVVTEEGMALLTLQMTATVKDEPWSESY